MPTSFVTGATGFIGSRLVERLLAREGDVHVLVRAGSRARLDALIAGWGAGERIHPVVGDLTAPGLGVDDGWVAAHAGSIDGFFHLAAIYDMTADEERNRVANVDGTRHAVQLANALAAKCLHHVSSVAAAGQYEGEVFTEAMYDENQPLEHPYHRTKFESEGIARRETQGAWRVYRPSIVLGDSRTGAMDKIDGPYYFFDLIRNAARVPSFVPLLAPRMGETNVVPVDFVVDALDHIAHLPGLDGRAFHLVSPVPQRGVEVLNAFCRAAGAPHLVEVLPEQALDLTLAIPGVRDRLLPALGVPPEVVDHVGFTCRFDCSQTLAALAGSAIACPPLEEYASTLWSYWLEHMA